MVLALALAGLPAGGATLPEGWPRDRAGLVALLFEIAAAPPPPAPRALPWLLPARAPAAGRIDLAVLEGPAGAAGRRFALPGPGGGHTLPLPALRPGVTVSAAEVAAFRAARRDRGWPVDRAAGRPILRGEVIADASTVPLPPGAALLPAALGLLALLRRRSGKRDNPAAPA